jgi:hypothetical protein
LTETILEKKTKKKQKKKKQEKKPFWKHYSNSVFCDESYSASPHDLALFVMTCNCNSQPAQY